MNKKKDIAIGLVVLVILAGTTYLITRNKNQKLEGLPLPTPSVQEKIEETFNIEIPENVERADLNDVSDGDSYGVATREENFVTVLADLPDLKSGEYYQFWRKYCRIGCSDQTHRI